MLARLLTAIGLASLVSAVSAQDIRPDPDIIEPPKKEYSPFVEQHFPTQVFFGDTHLHTNWSTDAGMIGTRLSPDDAYRFVRGEAVTS